MKPCRRTADTFFPTRMKTKAAAGALHVVLQITTDCPYILQPVVLPRTGIQQKKCGGMQSRCKRWQVFGLVQSGSGSGSTGRQLPRSHWFFNTCRNSTIPSPHLMCKKTTGDNQPHQWLDCRFRRWLARFTAHPSTLSDPAGNPTNPPRGAGPV